jgi:plastocyanin
MNRALVLGLGLLVSVYAAGCGGSQPADTAQQTPETGTDPGAPAAQNVQDLGASSITGTITFDGEAPTLPPLAMDAEPECADKHSGPVPAEMLVLGNGNTMGNIIVWVSNGLPAEAAWAVPTTPVVLDQRGCLYVPHAMGIMVGQPYRILNSDGILHNIHTLPEINRSFNRAMPATLTEVSTTFDQPEAIFQIKCDVHPWMLAYVGVFTHPFFSVTSADGTFQISGLDPGTYEISAWHERLGTQTASITVGDSDTTSQDFTFTIPAAS